MLRDRFQPRFLGLNMRILFCNFEYPPIGGGGGVFNKLIAEELAKRHEVTILTSQGFDLPTEEEQNGVHIVRVPGFFRYHKTESNIPSMLVYLTLGIFNGKRLLKNSQYDIINTHFALPTGPVGHVLAKRMMIPNVLSVHGGDLYDPSKFTSPHRHFLLRYWVRRLLRRANAVVGQSRNTITNIKKFYDPNIQPVKIPLGIKRPPNEVGLRQNYRFNKDDILLVTVGRLVARKAVDQLIAVMPHLKTTRAHLIIIGTGSLEQELRKKAQELNVRERVHFMGYVSEEEKFRILHMSDVFISTSMHEGFGLIFLEAMASGLPIICYDNGGQTDFLEDGQTGFVVRLNDQLTIVDRCQRLIQDTGMRKTMSAECLKMVEDYFIEQSASRYEALFHEVIQ